jgi:mRNA interferase RelE/StbE
MAKYEVTVLPSAQKEIIKLPKQVQSKVLKALVSLSENPRPNGCKKLIGSDCWRFRIGEYRIVYSIEDNVLLIEIIRVAHRKEVYS